jgi:hypothetical protein
MQQDKRSISEIAKELIKRHPEYFEALLEFERTKKLPKLNYKKRVNFTIDENLFREFRNFCEKKNLKMSGIIENFISNFLKNQQPS